MAIRYFLREVLGQTEEDAVAVADRSVEADRRRPVVLTRDEVRRLLENLEGAHRLMASLIYGTGLRVQECLALRIHDFDFARGTILIRDGHGTEMRQTILPLCLAEELEAQFRKSRLLYDEDLRVRRLRSPSGRTDGDGREGGTWRSSWAFPSDRISHGSLLLPRRHVREDGLQRAIKAATERAGIAKDGTCQTLRHSFAVHLLEANYDVRIVQKLLGHTDPRSTTIYLDVIENHRITLPSPLDTLCGDRRAGLA